MIRSLPLLLIACCCMQAAGASEPLQVQAQTPAAPAPVRPTVPGGQLPTTPPGPIPPRDPRLTPPNVTETTVPPNIVLPAPPPGTGASEVPLRPITADEAARIALRLQPTISLAHAAITVQQGRTRQIRAVMMPQVTMLGSYSRLVNLTHPERRSGSVAAGGTGSIGAGTTGGTSTTGTGQTGTGTQSGTTTGTGGTTGTGTTGTGGTTGSGGTTGNSGNASGSTNSGTTGTGTTGGTGTTTTTTGSSSSTGILAQGFSGQASLKQLIFDFNHTLDLVRQSATLEKAAAQNLSRVQNDTVLEVKQAFYLLVQNLQQVQVNEQEVANRQTQLDLARARFNIGLGLPSDIVTAQTAKAEAVLNLTQVRDNAEQAKISLAIYMGVDPRTPIVPAAAAEPPVASNDVNTLTQFALMQRPEVLQAQFNVRSAQFGVSAARSINSPVISGSVNAISLGNQFLPQENDLTAGISLSWTPIDGGTRRGVVQEARGNLTIAQQNLFIAQQTVKADVASAYVNLRSAEQRVTFAIADVANAEEGVRIATGRYSTGLGLFLDIINAQAFLLTARINLVNTQNAVEQYRVALQHATGAPIPRIR